MTFSVNGIKQENSEKLPIQILVCVDAPLLARKILEQTNILILSLKEFSLDKKTFGDVYFIIKLGFQEIEVVTKYENMQEACTFFTHIGFDIYQINSYTHPISGAEMNAIIAEAQKQAEQQKLQDQEQIQKQEDKEKKVYADKDLVSAKEVIIRMFEKVEETTKRSEGTIEIQDIKKIHLLTEDLKKLRMGTNVEKIREIVQELTKILEKINSEYYLRIQNSNDTILPDSLVTAIDVEKELERLETIQLLKKIGVKISLKNQDYATFGSSAIFWKFLQKDILYRLSDLSGVLYRIYDIAEIIITLLISTLGIYTISNEIYLFSLNQYGLSFSLITLGIRGILIYIARYLRTKKINRLLLLGFSIVLLYYLLLWLITTNFAL